MIIILKSLKVISLILIMTLLVACSIGGSEDANEKSGVLSEMKEIDDKIGNDGENEIDYDDATENEVLIDLALEEFKEESEHMGEFSNTRYSTLTIEDLRNVTDVQIWHNKYILINVNADNPDRHSSSDDFERYYKYENGELIDSQCKDGISGCSKEILTSEEMNFIKDEPNYKEESDNVLDLTKTFE